MAMAWRHIKGILCVLFTLFLALNSRANSSQNEPGYLQDSPAPALPSVIVANLESYLTKYQAEASLPWPALSEKKLIKPGKTSAIVEQIRDRLAVTGDFASHYSPTPDYFDPELQSAVRRFQQRMGLVADGVIGPATLHELNVSPAARAQQIEVNLKRWQEIASRAGDHYVLVNVPDFRLYLYEDGKKVLNMKTIVGKTTRQTPEIDSEITHIIFNPSWNVPQLIARKDIIPKILDNPDYLDDMHIHIYTSQENNAREIPERQIDWDKIAENGFPWHFRQDPGNDNALGRVKFEFDNSDSIYMHDTPTKNLFDQPVRLFSSGCIRLENPLALVASLMKYDPRWNEVRMQALLDKGKTAYVKLRQPTPVFIAYLTAWVDDRGVLNFRNDVYGRDKPQTSQPSEETEDS